MAAPNSGLDIKDRTWLKIPIPMSFLGIDLVDWLLDKVHGLRDRKDAKKYATRLLSSGMIRHVVNKISFTEQCYYVLGPVCADFARLRLMSEAEDGAGHMASVQHHQASWPLPANNDSSMVSGYASMPTAPATPAMLPLSSGAGRLPPSGAAAASQASGSGGSSGSSGQHRGRPPQSGRLGPSMLIAAAANVAPASSTALIGDDAPGTSSRLDDLPVDLAASRQSFRRAMDNPCEFFVDNL